MAPLGSDLRPRDEAWEEQQKQARWCPEGEDLAAVDQFDRLPDAVLLDVLNKIGDVKDLGRCCAVSRRFHSLALQADEVVVRVDCVFSDDPAESEGPSPGHTHPPPADKARTVLSQIARLVLGRIARPFQALGQIFSPPAVFSAKKSACGPSDAAPETVSHYSPTQVLRNFREIRHLRIELPGGEIAVDEGAFLKWKAQFGCTLQSCVILAASSIVSSSSSSVEPTKTVALDSQEGGEAEDFCLPGGGSGGGEDDGGVSGAGVSFHANRSFKLRVVWTISSLIAASARHYLLHPIIADHSTLDSLDLTDGDGQGVLRMDRAQLDELREKPASASGSSQRTVVPALNMRLWYAPHLELPGGVVMKGATLVAIRPSEQCKEVVGPDGGEWVASAFDEEPYGTAARLLLKRRTYCLEMNSF